MLMSMRIMIDLMSTLVGRACHLTWEPWEGSSLRELRPNTPVTPSQALRAWPRQTLPRSFAAGEGEGEARGGGRVACGVPKAGRLRTRWLS